MKRRLKLQIRVPSYSPPRRIWRQEVYRLIRQEMQGRGILYRPDEKLEVDLALFFTEPAISVASLGARVADLLDILRGRTGTGPPAEPILPGPGQLYRLVVEKRPRPMRSQALGLLTIQKARLTS